MKPSLKRGGGQKWSIIITSAHNTRTLKGMDTLDGIKLALKSSIEAMMAGMRWE
ncbi:hypothetical protein [Thermococcus indicus]|uniref:hypothetical protein n=1 Tax=Thermococcus indicus TaxID=2586643 RepID=UPI00143D7AC5|nr:hypothetical protein [Thermococcus indicus]